VSSDTQLSGHVPFAGLLSRSPVLFSCSPQHVGLMGKPIRSDASHNHVDSFTDSTLKAIASLTLFIITIVPPSCSSSNPPAYLEFASALVKISSLINGCCGPQFIFCSPPLHALHLPPSTQLHLMKVLAKLFDDTALCTLLTPRSAWWILSPSCTLKF